MTKYHILLLIKPVIKGSKCFGPLQWISHDSSVPSVSPYLMHKILKNWFLKSSAKEDVTK